MASADAPSATVPRCAVHPESPAGGICGRCGGFFCDACATWVLGAVYCTACAALPEVNYLETFRLKLWGRRDSWAWMLGFWGLVALGLGAVLLFGGDTFAGVLALACAGVGVGCFFRQGWARVGLLAVPAGMVVAGLVREDPALGLPSLFLLGLAYTVHQDPRHRLFFRLPLPDAVLLRLWDRFENNPLARLGLQLGLYGVLVPVFAPLALGLGFVALRRVNPEARPPIGHGGQALAAMGLGLGSLVLWVGLFWPRLSELLHALFAAG
ncbi:DUF4190 domain-containing protein [Vitiosangium sp. GDMCC 1.1324]|uniref:DUF4190 domain-containing protein n=1 Tax=Vitiosangium sp. (strain GDMCC 1.1324) TaxID=2138576 RepID=UPI000D3C9C69|nr:DUF4190 domain-containing protein [Vitiosangium sp. GDMCC 1.1324]PTL77123.1 hypothetical protein DAT35_46660 [Vitiosangium sp. GDMCC 1.1324]